MPDLMDRLRAELLDSAIADEERAITTDVADSIGVMRAIKDLLDPRGILNPGKMIPVAS